MKKPSVSFQQSTEKNLDEDDNFLENLKIQIETEKSEKKFFLCMEFC